MIERNIDMAMLKPHGQTYVEMKDDALLFASAKEHPLCACKDIRHYYVEAPDRYRLPLKVDVTAKIEQIRISG